VRRDSALAIVALAAVGAAVVISSSARLDAHPTTDVTWNRDVARILQDHCAVCHHGGGAVSLDLTDYAQARRWAHAIARNVLERRMPPWRAAPGFGDFANDRSLSTYEIDVITAWVNGGTRIGPPLPPQRAVRDHDPFDATVELGGTAAPVAGAVRALVLPASDRERWISGWEFRPGDASVVKDASISIGDMVIGTWSPGEPATVLPDGTGYRIPAATTVRARIRYRDVEPRVMDTTRVALRLSPRPLHEIAQLRVRPGARVLVTAMDVLAVRPRVGASGTSVQIIARHRDGSIEPLLVIDRGDAEAAVTYRCRRPVRLESGTVVKLLAFDRSSRATLDYVATAR